MVATECGRANRPFLFGRTRFRGAPSTTRPPHTEDRNVPIAGHQIAGQLESERQIAWLDRTTFASVREIFDAEVHSDASTRWGRYVLLGEGSRSLGTIVPHSIEEVDYAQFDGGPSYRVQFSDQSGEQFRLAINALDIRRKLDELHADGLAPHAVGPAIVRVLQDRGIYIRIGLGRVWKENGCYLQVTGIYDFPR